MSISTPEDRELILRDKAAREGFEVPQDVIDFLVERFDTERRLKSELINIAMFAAHRQIPISLDVTKLVVDGERVRPLSTMIPEFKDDVPNSETAGSQDASQVAPPAEEPTVKSVTSPSITAAVAATDTKEVAPATQTETVTAETEETPTLFTFDNTEVVTHNEAKSGASSAANSDVFFIPLRTQRKRSLLDRINLALTRAGIDNMIQEDDRVAVKVHFGEEGNTGFVSPLYARTVVSRAKELGAKPFLTDTNTLYSGKRQNAIDHTELALANGFGYSSVGAPIIIADGLISRDSIEVPVENGTHFESVRIASAAVDADAMIVISHVKGHGEAGFGGALKNVGMGLGSRSAKQRMHSGIKPSVTADNCIACARCVDWCQPQCVEMRQGSTGARYAHINEENCNGCGECLAACAYNAIEINWETSPQDFLEKTIEHAAGALGTFTPNKVIYLNFLTNISPDCDCWSFSDAPIVPDIGILVSCDPVAIDQASVDLVEQALGASGSRGEDLKAGQEKFEAIHGVEPAMAMRYSEKLGLGTQNYRLRTVG
ncbi:MAG: DUF362 domain-containing protein [Coriobacteriia bacterium]|nr:DUF362 domain-containing protein [Coriobacteriia bacterium]MCL2745692.1 DUF362 domain-containing protein [Coriobacteriia bacterium]MCL2870458.1 DUF362 domain-containing protein [Coriobacteriia bacterium]